MQDRDRATSDAEYLQDKNLELDIAVKNANTQLEYERQLTANLQRLHVESTSAIQRLQREAADARLIPALREKLQKREASFTKLTEVSNTIQVGNLLRHSYV